VRFDDGLVDAKGDHPLWIQPNERPVRGGQGFGHPADFDTSHAPGLDRGEVIHNEGGSSVVGDIADLWLFSRLKPRMSIVDVVLL
jgi:hypothetical protein